MDSSDRKIWIGNIPDSFTEYRLLQICRKYGDIDEFNFKRSGKCGNLNVRPKAYFAFISYKNNPDAEKALASLTKLEEFRKANIKCKWVSTEKSKEVPKQMLKDVPTKVAKEETGSRKRQSINCSILKIEEKLRRIERQPDEDFSFEPSEKPKIITSIVKPLIEKEKRNGYIKNPLNRFINVKR